MDDPQGNAEDRLAAHREAATITSQLRTAVAERDAAVRDGRLEDAQISRAAIDRLLGHLSYAIERRDRQDRREGLRDHGGCATLATTRGT